ncbi:uncharacterized protein LOC135846369 isoform X3 [Planococcus citri]|uniref:uncharacterized protein LOC135846369 isoform X3 n=1 Tax=Planococcus citri TaxID=170843 RepID=UPI0031F95387
MAEINSDVFDIFHPTPVPLRELSAIVISLEIWRCEIIKYRSSGSLKDLRPSDRSISSKTMIPDLPSTIYPMIDTYVKRFGLSMNYWLWKHHGTIFRYHYDNQYSVLEYFEDFVCEYNGTIDYEKTAKRMMHCDRFDVHQKFLIACTYCFEDDMIRIWPLGLKKTDSLCERYFKDNPHFANWIDFLENHIKIPEPPMEEWGLDDFMPHSRSSLEYFWNLTPSENRLSIAIDLCRYDLALLVRFIFPKLDVQQLDEFLRTNGCVLLYALLKRSWYDEEAVLSSWVCVKNMINEVAFTNLTMKIMQSEFRGYCDEASELHYGDGGWCMYDDDDDFRGIDAVVQLCIEIWNTAAENLKRSAVRDITSNNSLFKDIFTWLDPPLVTGELKFSLAVLSYATYEQRNAFWHYCWRDLIMEAWGEDLHEIMRLCLPNEDEITQFKENIVANDENILSTLRFSLAESSFYEVNGLARFLFPDIQAAINFKRRIGYYDYAFIDDAYDSYDDVD